MRESTVTDKPQCRKDNAANNDCDANEFQRLGKLINEGMDLVGQIPIPLHIQVVVALMLAFRLLRDAGANGRITHACRLHVILEAKYRFFKCNQALVAAE